MTHNQVRGAVARTLNHAIRKAVRRNESDRVHHPVANLYNYVGVGHGLCGRLRVSVLLESGADEHNGDFLAEGTFFNDNRSFFIRATPVLLGGDNDVFVNALTNTVLVNDDSGEYKED